jgi:DNA-binding NarL/FixJ family response regulator
VSASSTGEEAAQWVRRTRPDVIVTQLDMQPKTAEEIISGLARGIPGLQDRGAHVVGQPRYVQAVSGGQ